MDGALCSMDRHIVKLIRDEEAHNITWVWHPDANDHPDEAWNRFENYYPGDDVVDWVGFSCYGYLTPRDDWHPRSFRDILDAAYHRAQKLAPGKPIIVAEFGHAAGNPRQDAVTWATTALDDLLGGRWPTSSDLPVERALANDDNQTRHHNAPVRQSGPRAGLSKKPPRTSATADKPRSAALKGRPMALRSQCDHQ